MTSPAELANLLIERIAVDDIELLRTESIDAIEVLFDVPVTLVERGTIPGGCGVEGRYFDNPPHIQVATSYTKRRRAFTALHELAHHLVGIADNADIAIALAGFPRFGEKTEETIANEFAARILIPEGLCTDHIASTGPTAANIATLYDQSQGSLRACLLRAAGFQPDEGYIVMARDGVVEYAQPTAGAYDTGSGGRHPHSHLFQQAERNGSATRSPVRLIARSGVESREFHGDATSHRDYVLAVLTSARRPTWGPTQTGLDLNPVWLEVDCEDCRRTTWGFRLCPTCKGAVCANESERTPVRCDWCDCRSAAVLLRKLCTRCSSQKHVSQFESGGDICSDCR
jgi:Zn-dependent peptidase ImmA (M78 family)